MKDVALHLPSLRRYARYLTRDADAAEDLLQDCLVNAIAGAHTLRPGAPLRPWLFRIMYTSHVAGWRRRSRLPIAAEEAPERAVEARQEAPIELSDVLRALDELPEPQRDAIVLVAIEDLSYEDAARVLNVPLGTLMSRLSRGRANLRRVVEGSAPPTLRVVNGGRP
jgi:RNA polymerase sigma-70 factor (ECF subfamily)